MRERWYFNIETETENMGKLEKDTHTCRPLEESKLFGSRRAVVLEAGSFEEVAVEVAMLKTQCLATLSSITGKQLK